MRIAGSWLTRRGTQAVLAMLTGAGYQAYLVGGCVRNALLGAPVDDVDITTDALPETVVALAEEAQMRPVPTGIDHGTITVVTGGIGYEVTTFRADVETDGRRAVVRYSADIVEDARRRDFTMNALYARADGSIVDPLGGLPDLQARRVVFIENPDQRIREDYLRILRFFRFTAWYGDPAAGMDTAALDAIARNLDGIETLSRERLGMETVKLMAAPDPAPAVAAMQVTGALQRVLPGADATALAPLVHLEQSVGVAPDPMRRLAAIGAFDGASLRLSKARQKALESLRAALSSMAGAGELGFRLGAESARDVLLLRAASMGQPLDPAEIRASQAGAAAIFPVTAADLMPGLTGAALGAALKTMEARWIASGFTLTREALLRP
ncbi:MAG: CCA tRNA nucleotidyltransferase [Roseivivax sp.]|nr:CCA tRNA nucleotidyltransferase [Roseivivax sp.]